MATFAKSSFNVLNYASIRPTYPQQLFEYVFNFHKKSGKAQWDRAVDLGCGTGQVTAELTAFKEVYGVDPSSKMVVGAQKAVEALNVPNKVVFVEGNAEELPFLEDHSVDLIVAGQAAHWFTYDKLWPELARVLKSKGSFAFWGYSEFRLSKYPALTPLIREYAQGSDPSESLGPHWQQPGRNIIDNHFFDIPPPPETEFEDWEHAKSTGYHYPEIADAKPVILKKTLTWEGLEAYLRSFSALHTYHERYPEDAAKKDKGDGDIAQRFVKRLQEGVAQSTGSKGDSIDIEWPLAIIMARRK